MRLVQVLRGLVTGEVGCWPCTFLASVLGSLATHAWKSRNVRLGLIPGEELNWLQGFCPRHGLLGKLDVPL